MHCVWPGPQTPAQAPPVHVWFTHATGALHVCVSAEHVETPLPLHSKAPGEHCAHMPFAQTGVGSMHVDWSCQVPVASHVCAMLPRHCDAPSVQTPTHWPPTHVWLSQSPVPPQPDWQVLLASQCSPAGHVCVGKRHWTHAPVWGSQNVFVAAHASSVHVPVPVVLDVEPPADAPPVDLKPPYWGNPHDAMPTKSAAKNAAKTRTYPQHAPRIRYSARTKQVRDAETEHAGARWTHKATLLYARDR